jgi:hypothetical protein
MGMNGDEWTLMDRQWWMNIDARMFVDGRQWTEGVKRTSDRKTLCVCVRAPKI